MIVLEEKRLEDYEEIKKINELINKKRNQINNLKVTRDAINESLEQKSETKSSMFKVYDSCNAERLANEKILTTYKEYKEQFTQDNINQLMNKEMTNMCKYHMLVEDIKLVLPAYALQVDEASTSFYKKSDTKPITELLGSDIYYMYNEDDK